jgi:hypothetical protein
MKGVMANGINSAWGGVGGSQKGVVREIEATADAITWFPELRMENYQMWEVAPFRGAHRQNPTHQR